MCLYLSYSFNVQINHVQRASAADVYAVDAHKGVGNGLTAVGGNGVGDVVGYYIHAHASFDADATGELAVLDSYAVYHIGSFIALRFCKITNSLFSVSIYRQL